MPLFDWGYVNCTYKLLGLSKFYVVYKTFFVFLVTKDKKGKHP